MKGTKGIYSLIALAAVGLAGTCAAEEKAPAAKPDATCAACHGPGGTNPAATDTPRLAGQAEDYLVHALREYRSGGRPSPIMGAMAASLSDAQILELARFYAAQSGLTAKY